MSKNVLMTIGGNESSFAVEDKQDVVFLPVGFDLVSLRYFKHSPPTYDDIEYAINYIEDEIERVAKKVPYDGYSLVTDQPFIQDLAKLSRAVGWKVRGAFSVMIWSACLVYMPRSQRGVQLNLMSLIPL